MDQRTLPIGYVRYADSYPAGLRYLYQAAPLAGRRQTRRYLALAVFGALVVVALGFAVAFVAPIVQQYPARLTTPDSLAGMPRVTGGPLADLGNRFRVSLAARVHPTSTIAAFYAPPESPDFQVMVAGATGFVADPSNLTGRLTRLGVHDVEEVGPGSMGGYMACGQLLSASASVTLCAWSDYGSVGTVIAPGRGTEDAAALLRTARLAALKR